MPRTRGGRGRSAGAGLHARRRGRDRARSSRWCRCCTSGAAEASQAMRESSTRTTAGAARVWMRSALVVAEVALAVTLVVGAGLLIRSFMNLTRVDMGFNRSQLTTFGLVLPAHEVQPAAARRLSTSELLTTLRALPGVQSVAAMSGLPPLRNVNANDTDFEHIPNNRRRRAPPADRRTWTSGSTCRSATPRRWAFPVVKGRDVRAGGCRRRAGGARSTRRWCASSSRTAIRSAAASSRASATRCRGSRSSAC